MIDAHDTFLNVFLRASVILPASQQQAHPSAHCLLPRLPRAVLERVSWFAGVEMGRRVQNAREFKQALHRDVSGSSNAAIQSALTSNNEWYYKDDFSGNVEGPFTGARMSQWHSQGCFDSVPNLPLRQGESGGFYPLSRLHLLDLGGGWN